MPKQSIKKNGNKYLDISMIILLIISAIAIYVFSTQPSASAAGGNEENSDTTPAPNNAAVTGIPMAPVKITIQAPDTGNLEDAKVRSSFPNNNYGTDAYLETYLTAFGDKRRTFVKYNISNISANSIVNNFSVCFYHYSNYLSEIRTIELHKVTNHTWSEHAITWNAQPSWTDKAIAKLNFSVGDIYEWRCFKNSDGSKWITPSDIAAGNVSFMIKDSAEEAIPAGWYIYSKESDISQKPYLEVTYTEYR